MGNLWGHLKVELQTPLGQKPVNHTDICLTTLHTQDDSSVYFGQCSLLGTYAIETKTGVKLGEFKGCPETISIPFPKGSGNKDEMLVNGNCQYVPIPLSNTALKFIVGACLALIFGSLFMLGIVDLYKHSDSTNEAIIQGGIEGI